MTRRLRRLRRRLGRSAERRPLVVYICVGDPHPGRSMASRPRLVDRVATMAS